MPSEVVQFSHDKRRPQASAATFLSVVAYPVDNKRRSRFMRAAVSSVVRSHAIADPKWARAPQMMVPRVLLLDRKEVERDLNHCGRELITHRLPAAIMVKWLLLHEDLKRLDPEGLANLFSVLLGKRLSKIDFKIEVPIKVDNSRYDDDGIRPHRRSERPNPAHETPGAKPNDKTGNPSRQIIQTHKPATQTKQPGF